MDGNCSHISTLNVASVMDMKVYRYINFLILASHVSLLKLHKAELICGRR